MSKEITSREQAEAFILENVGETSEKPDFSDRSHWSLSSHYPSWVKDVWDFMSPIEKAIVTELAQASYNAMCDAAGEDL